MVLVLAAGMVYSQNSSKSYFFKINNKQASTMFSKEMSKQFEFYYKLEVRNDTIFPYFCLDSIGNECFMKVPYMLLWKENFIDVRYFEEALSEEEVKSPSDLNYEVTLFSKDAKDTIKLSEPIDFPIMFFDDNVKTTYTQDDYVLFDESKFDCMKFKLINFPVNGYSFIYIAKDGLFPIKFEVFSFASRKDMNSVKEYSSVNLYKIE